MRCGVTETPEKTYQASWHYKFGSFTDREAPRRGLLDRQKKRGPPSNSHSKGALPAERPLLLRKDERDSNEGGRASTRRMRPRTKTITNS